MRFDRRFVSALGLIVVMLVMLSCQRNESPTVTPTPLETQATTAPAPATATATTAPAPATSTPTAAVTPAATATPPGPIRINCSGPDTDSDGLPDCYEDSIGTSIFDVDTDGDNLSDYEEVVNKAFDPQANNFQFNPLIADLPTISIDLTTVPEISINYTTSQGQSSTITNTESTEIASQVRTSQTSEESQSFEAGGTAFPKGTVSVTNSWTTDQIQ